MTKDKVKAREYKRRYNEKHKEEITKARRAYYSDPVNRARHNEKQKEWYRNNREKAMENNRKRYKPEYDRERKLRRYGITPEDYNSMFESQNGRCAVCGVHQSELSKPLFVDHEHDTGITRGLLCQRCNFAIGLFDDDVGRLLDAIRYLKGVKVNNG